MSVLDDLSGLISKVAYLSLPGIVAALAYAVYLWPPLPQDIIEVAKPCANRGQGNCPAQLPAQPDALTFPVAGDEPTGAVATYAADTGKPACNPSSMTLPQPVGLFDYQTPVKNQMKLDEQIQVYQKCVQTEIARQGAEDALIKDINQVVTQLTTDFGKIDDAYQAYAISNNPLRHKYEGDLRRRKHAIFVWQTTAVQLQLVGQERARRLKDLNRQQDILTARQADPGRLRPRQKFDDVLASLGQHVSGFTTIAVAWGLLLTPISQAAFSFYYLAFLKFRWDYVRQERGPPIKELMKIWKQVSGG